MTAPHLNDRAVGALVGSAVGDALGVPYEFGTHRLVPPARVLVGGLGDYAPGQWSDDTEMAVCIAQVAATGAGLPTADALDEVPRGFLRWYDTEPADIGNQTRAVLSAARPQSGRPSEALTHAAAELHERTGPTAGNGSPQTRSP